MKPDKDDIRAAIAASEAILLLSELRQREPRYPGFHPLSHARASVIKSAMRECSHDLLIMALAGLASGDTLARRKSWSK